MSSLFSSKYGKHLDPDTKINISRNIGKIKECFDWTKIQLTIDHEDLDLTKRNYDEVIELREIYRHIAKLSVDFRTDYEHYQPFTFKSRYDHEEYIEGLKNLGFICTDGVWESNQRPEYEIVIMNIFIYRLLIFMCEIIIPSRTKCPYCDNNIKDVTDPCDCGASVNDIESMQLKIKKRRNTPADVERDLDSGFKSSSSLRNVMETERKQEDCVNNDKVIERQNPGRSIVDEQIPRFRSSPLNVFHHVNLKIEIQSERRNNNNDCFITNCIESSRIDHNQNGKKDECNFDAKCVAENPMEKTDWKNKDMWKCGGCELFNNYLSVNCDACGNLYINGAWICESCNTVNACIGEHCKDCQRRNYNVKELEVDDSRTIQSTSSPETSEEVGKSSGNLKTNIEWKNKDMWKCGRCGLFNNYLSVNCDACSDLYKNGVWICEGCNRVNACIGEQCKDCQRRNSNIKPLVRVVSKPVIDDRICNKCGGWKSDIDAKCTTCNPVKKIEKKPISNDEWECCSCECRQSYLTNQCGACEGDRVLIGRWGCYGCTFLNKMSIDNCEVCGQLNGYITAVKQLIDEGDGDGDGDGDDNDDGNGDDENLWLCCSEFIDVKLEFCPKCFMWRHNSTDRGAECKQIYKDKERKVWICVKCHNATVVKESVCQTKKCNETRYAKMPCPGCKVVSNGKSDCCKKCKQKLT